VKSSNNEYGLYFSKACQNTKMHFPSLLVLLKGSDFLAPYMYVQLMFSYLWGFSVNSKFDEKKFMLEDVSGQ